MAQALVQPDRPHLTRSGLFLVGAVLLLPVVAAFVALAAPKLATLQHRSLPVLTATHLVTLGWGTMVALGALHQLLPAAAGVRHDPPRLAGWQFGLHLWGVIILAGGFWSRHTGWLIVGVTAVVCSVLVSFGTAACVLARRTRWSWPLSYVTIAVAGLVAATFWGATLALNWRFGFWKVLLLPVGLTVHLTLGLVLWFAFLITGVSYYLLVRFTTHRTLDDTRVRAVFVLLLAGWVTLAITGQAYKVTPFLMWYYRFALGMAAYDVPRMEAPYWPRTALPPLLLLGGAGPLISLGVLLAMPWVSAAGGAAYFLGACVFSWLLGYSWLPRLWKVRAGPAI